MLDVAHVDRCRIDQFSQRLAPFFTADAVDYIGTGFGQHAADVKRDALAVCDTEDEDLFVFEL